MPGYPEDDDDALEAMANAEIGRHTQSWADLLDAEPRRLKLSLATKPDLLWRMGFGGLWDSKWGVSDDPGLVTVHDIAKHLLRIQSEWEVNRTPATMSENGFPLPHWVGTKHNDKTLKDEIGHFRFSSNPLVMCLFPIPCKISVGHWARLSAGERMQWHARVGENTVDDADITQDTDTATWGDMRTWAKHNDTVNNNLRARQETGKGWIASLNSSSRLTKRFLSTLF